MTSPLITAIAKDWEVDPKGIFVESSGPFPNATKWSDWEEFPEWVVGFCSDDTCDLVGPKSTIRRFTHFEDADIFAERLAKKHGVEFVPNADRFF